MKLIRSVALQLLTPTHNEISFVFYRKSINCMNATSKFRFEPFFPLFCCLFCQSHMVELILAMNSVISIQMYHIARFWLVFFLCNFWSVATFRQIYSQNIVSDICSFWIIFLYFFVGFIHCFFRFPFSVHESMIAERLLKYLVKELRCYYYYFSFINFYNICSCLYLTKSMINKNIHLKCHHAHLQSSLYN